MKKWVYLAFLLTFATTNGLEDQAADMFTTSLGSIVTCFSNGAACSSCLSQCPSAANTFFLGMIDSPSNTISLLRTCRREISDQRTGMEPWCVNDAQGFHATDQFNATETSCKMEPVECAPRLNAWAKKRVEDGKMSQSDPDYQLVQKIFQVGIANAEATRSENWYNGQVTKYNRLQEWWNEDVLAEMTKHLTTPEANDTRFSDPVYHNLTAIKEETRQRDISLYRNSLQNARVENGFVKQDTLESIRQSLKSILSLSSQIASQRNLTEGYLEEIKDTVVKINVAQERATDFAYETAYTNGLDGEVVSLDKDILKTFRELKSAQEVFNEMVTKVTITKVKLTFAMRLLVKEIVAAQMKVRCDSREIFTM